MIMNERERIGRRIADLRKEKGLTQKELAEAAGLDRTNITKIEAGKYNISIDILSKVANVLECHFDIVSVSEYDMLRSARTITEP